MSETWFISDTHWGHKNIIQYSNRPFASVEEMNEKLIDNWNRNVKTGDTVYHLGDFSFQSYKEFVPTLLRLHGNIHVVLGNHDQNITKNRNELLKIKLSSIQNYLEVKVPGCPMLILFHYGMRVWNKSHHDSIHLYGHSHGSLPPFGKSVDVGVDCTEVVCATGPGGLKTQDEYRPIHLDEIIAYMSKKTKSVVDHHDGNRD